MWACFLADDFIVDEMGRPINRKKGGDQNTDMYVVLNCDIVSLHLLSRAELFDVAEIPDCIFVCCMAG